MTQQIEAEAVAADRNGREEKRDAGGQFNMAQGIGEGYGDVSYFRRGTLFR